MNRLPLTAPLSSVDVPFGYTVCSLLTHRVIYVLIRSGCISFRVELLSGTVSIKSAPVTLVDVILLMDLARPPKLPRRLPPIIYVITLPIASDNFNRYTPYRRFD